MGTDDEPFAINLPDDVASPPPDANHDAPFYVAATAGPSRPRLTLKHDDTFVVLDSHGDIDAGANGADGLFDGDTRFLSHLRLSIDGQEPLLLGYSVRDDSLTVDVDLTNPDVCRDGHIVLLKNTVHVARTIFVQGGSLRTRISLTNYGHEPVAFTVSFDFDSDFADLFEVRGLARSRRGTLARRISGASSASFRYSGLDGTPREMNAAFWPRPSTLAAGTATYDVELSPGAKTAILLEAGCRAGVAPSASAFVPQLVRAHRTRRLTLRELPVIETSNATLNETLKRSLADFYMLVSRTAQGPYPYAGVPWFSTTFGRDGIIAAMEMLWLDPGVARGVLKRLAHFQATETDAAADAEPGKILHEMRAGEMAALHEVPFGRYYGSVDSTPLFVMLAGEYASRTGDHAFIAEIWPAIERALHWIDAYGDRDCDGFVEYPGESDHGLANQGWKDSHDSTFGADGELVRGPIALVEVQGYVYAAKRQAAALARALGRAAQAAALEEAAELLRERFEAAFWDEELGTYVLALDGDKKPARVRASNAGHALFAGIASESRARATAKTLLAGASFSGWGVRTVAAGEVRYNPISYHNGSIWPHDNALIAAGLRRYRLGSSVTPIFEGLTEAAAHMDQRRLPELFCGFPRRKGRSPTLYPVACSPQAWASAAVFQLVQSLLGLSLDFSARKIVLDDPQLPRSVREISVRNVRLGDMAADLTLAREGAEVYLVKASGDLPVEVGGKRAY